MTRTLTRREERNIRGHYSLQRGSRLVIHRKEPLVEREGILCASATLYVRRRPTIYHDVGGSYMLGSMGEYPIPLICPVAKPTKRY
ncbi:MAG: hypothetical protein Q7S22_05470 [Candidatus Micrarchaeota archaeon]|nr:hypothetical protein [Candidatus Micrarchaeota archaeon]